MRTIAMILAAVAFLAGAPNLPAQPATEKPAALADATCCTGSACCTPGATCCE